VTGYWERRQKIVLDHFFCGSCGSSLLSVEFRMPRRGTTTARRFQRREHGDSHCARAEGTVDSFLRAISWRVSFSRPLRDFGMRNLISRRWKCAVCYCRDVPAGTTHSGLRLVLSKASHTAFHRKQRGTVLACDRCRDQSALKRRRNTFSPAKPRPSRLKVEAESGTDEVTETSVKT